MKDARKYKIDPAELEELYIQKRKSRNNLAAHFNCSKANIDRLLKKHGIKCGSTKGRHAAWNKGLTKETSEAVMKQSKSIEGENNPMAGADPWNLGLTVDTDQRVKLYGDKRRGTLHTEETKGKMSEQAKRLWENNPTERGMSGRNHADESLQKMRDATIRRYENGDFDHIYSKPHRKVAEFTISIDDSFSIEVRSGRYLFDVASPEKSKFIEVHGDYFHRNPKALDIMARPINNLQKKNTARDKVKEDHIECIGAELLVVWEKDINENWEKVKEAVIEFIEVENVTA